MLLFWCLRMAKYVAATPIVSMDATNTRPASTCGREPLRKTTAAAPDSSPSVPPRICTSNIGEYRINESLQIYADPHLIVSPLSSIPGMAWRVWHLDGFPVIEHYGLLPDAIVPGTLTSACFHPKRQTLRAPKCSRRDR